MSIGADTLTSLVDLLVDVDLGPGGVLAVTVTDRHSGHTGKGGVLAAGQVATDTRQGLCCACGSAQVAGRVETELQVLRLRHREVQLPRDAAVGTSFQAFHLPMAFWCFCLSIRLEHRDS